MLVNRLGFQSEALPTILLPRGKPKSRAKDIYVLDKLRKHFGAETTLDKITSGDIAKYRDDLVTKHGLQPSSANREVSYTQAVGAELRIAPSLRYLSLSGA